MLSDDRRTIRHDLLIARLRRAQRRNAARLALRMRLVRLGTRWSR